MLNLSSSLERAQLSKQISNEIDTYCINKYNDGPRSHLGASKIGENCSKALWIGFRWIAHKQADGSQYRLFQRGHFEEPRFIQYLEGIGCYVQQFAKALWFHPESDSYFIDDIDFNCSNSMDAGLCNDVTNNPLHLKLAEERGVKFDKGKMQLRISDCKGHFGGSLDAEVERYDFGKMLCEMKTQGVGTKEDKFDKLVKEGVKKNKPVHYAQMCVYGFKRNLEYAIYMSVNKTNDDLHIEVIKLDWEFAQDLIRKAEMIIFSHEAPQGVSCSPSYFECNWCDFKGVCYSTEQPLVNCRSCINSYPVEDAAWHCKRWNSVIPTKEAILAACPEWSCIL